jgi:hypothetical protein
VDVVFEETAELADDENEVKIPIAELVELPVPVGTYKDVVFEGIPYGADVNELKGTLACVGRGTVLTVPVGP